MTITFPCLVDHGHQLKLSCFPSFIHILQSPQSQHSLSFIHSFFLRIKHNCSYPSMNMRSNSITELPAGIFDKTINLHTIFSFHFLTHSFHSITFSILNRHILKSFDFHSFQHILPSQQPRISSFHHHIHHETMLCTSIEDGMNLESNSLFYLDLVNTTPSVMFVSCQSFNH